MLTVLHEAVNNGLLKDHKNIYKMLPPIMKQETLEKIQQKYRNDNHDRHRNKF